MILFSHRAHRALRGTYWRRAASINRGDRSRAKGGGLWAKTSKLVFAQRLPSFFPIVSIGTSDNLWEVLSDQIFFELSEGYREPAGGNGCDNLTIDRVGGIR